MERVEGAVLLILIITSMFSIGLNVLQFLNQPTPICEEPNVDVSCPQAEPKVNLSCPKPYCPKPECPEPKCPEQGLIKKFASNVVKEHNFELDKYDCTQYANELARRLKDAGFDAEAELIQVDCSADIWGATCKEYDGRHRIVRLEDVYIEATTGNVINPLDYEDYNLKG